MARTLQENFAYEVDYWLNEKAQKPSATGLTTWYKVITDDGKRYVSFDVAGSIDDPVELKQYVGGKDIRSFKVVKGYGVNVHGKWYVFDELKSAKKFSEDDHSELDNMEKVEGLAEEKDPIDDAEKKEEVVEAAPEIVDEKKKPESEEEKPADTESEEEYDEDTIGEDYPDELTTEKLDKDFKDFMYVERDQDVDMLKEEIGEAAQEFDSFFVKVSDGKNEVVYGVVGKNPAKDTKLTKVFDIYETEDDEESESDEKKEEVKENLLECDRFFGFDYIPEASKAKKKMKKKLKKAKKAAKKEKDDEDAELEDAKKDAKKDKKKDKKIEESFMCEANALLNDYSDYYITESDDQDQDDEEIEECSTMKEADKPVDEAATETIALSEIVDMYETGLKTKEFGDFQEYMKDPETYRMVIDYVEQDLKWPDRKVVDMLKIAL